MDNNLLLHYPSDALTALDAFLSLDKKIMNRCDDSNGSISDEFRYAVDLWGRAWNNLPDFDARTLVKALEKRITSNSYGLFDNIVPAAGAALKKKGLDELEQLMRSHYAQNKELFYAYNTLRDIALLRESPEAFKEVFELGNYKGTVSDQLDLARLLIKAQRTEEAIQLLETIDDTSHYGAPSLDLLIEIYDAVKNISASQRLRWRGFTTRSDLKYYHEYIQYLPTDAEKQTAFHDAATLASNHANIIVAMQLLAELGCHDKAAHVLRTRYNELNGRSYYSLQDLADYFTASGYPLKAILIYRCLIEETLGRAQARYYDYAIRYLKKSKTLDKQVKNWDSYPDTDIYLGELKKQHVLKKAFIAKCNLKLCL